MSFFSNLGSTISGWFSKAVPEVETAFTSAEKIVNVLKTFLGSATGQTIEAIIEAFFPGASTAVFAALNTWFNDFGLVTSASTGNAAQDAAIGLNKVATLTGNSKIIALTNLATIVGDAISNSTGGNTTIQEANVALQLIHNPNLLSGETVPVTSAAPAPAPDPSTVPSGNLATGQGDTSFLAQPQEQAHSQS